jgi:hypothetical protein
MNTITVSLEWAERLKDAGWSHGTTYHAWRLNGCTSDPTLVQYDRGGFIPGKDYESTIGFIDAPTAEEILRKLPGHVKFNKDEPEYILYCRALNNPKGHKYLTAQWSVYYEILLNGIPHRGGKCIGESTLADAAANMYCYLSENNLLPCTKNLYEEKTN